MWKEWKEWPQLKTRHQRNGVGLWGALRRGPFGKSFNYLRDFPSRMWERTSCQILELFLFCTEICFWFTVALELTKWDHLCPVQGCSSREADKTGWWDGEGEQSPHFYPLTYWGESVILPSGPWLINSGPESSPVKGTEQEVRGEFPTVAVSSPSCTVRNTRENEICCLSLHQPLET